MKQKSTSGASYTATPISGKVGVCFKEHVNLRMTRSLYILVEEGCGGQQEQSARHETNECFNSAEFSNAAGRIRLGGVATGDTGKVKETAQFMKNLVQHAEECVLFAASNGKLPGL